MATAQSKIWVYHGSGAGATTDISGGVLRYKQADDSTADLNNPVPIPSSGTAYSAIKFMKIAFITSPQNYIGNLRWFYDPRPETSDPALAWDGLTIWAGVTASYAPSAAAPSGLGGGITANCDSITAANPFVLVGSTLLTTGQTGVGASQPYVQSQIALNSNALSGVKAGRGFWYRWIEY